MSPTAPDDAWMAAREVGGSASPLHAIDGSLASAPSGTVIDYPYTGDYRVDVLLDGVDQEGYTPLLGITPEGVGALVYRWNDGRPLGTPVTVTYSFMSASPVYGGTDDGNGTGFQAFNTEQRAAVKQILAQLQQEIGVTFKEVTDSAAGYGQIRFGDNVQQQSSGYAWLPNSTGDGRGGDVWIDSGTAYNLSNLKPGTFGYETLLHEIGHALGLKHPGNYNAGTVVQDVPGNYLGGAQDNANYTVMSYSFSPYGHQARDDYGMYDLLALRTLYGAGTGVNAGDTTYRLVNASGQVLDAIDDSSGTDTIDISALSSPGTGTASWRVDMRPGAFSSVGFSGIGQATNNVSIAYGTTIEKFVGSAWNDRVTGNDADNVFVLGGGTNVADGGAGLDTVSYGAARTNYQAAASGGVITVTGGAAQDTLTNVERLAFSGSGLAFDLAGHAGTVAKIIAAVFGAPTIAQHPDYVGIGLADLDAGMSYADLMTKALGFQLAPAHTNAQLVDLLYSKVLGAAPTPEQAAPYLAQLDSHAQSESGLGILAAESAPNADHVNLVGLAATGLAFA